MAADLLELFRSAVRMIEDGVATEVIMLQVMSATCTTFATSANWSPPRWRSPA